MMTTIKRLAREKSGYTLVELIIYFALVSLLFVQLTSLFITVLDAKKDTQAVSSVERDGQFIYARLLYDVARAEAITVPLSLGETAESVSLTIDGVEHTYQVVDGKLVLTVDGISMLLHTQTLASELLATRLGNVGGQHTLKLQFRITSPIQETTGSETRLYQTTIGLRQ